MEKRQKKENSQLRTILCIPEAYDINWTEGIESRVYTNEQQVQFLIGLVVKRLFRITIHEVEYRNELHITFSIISKVLCTNGAY